MWYTLDNITRFMFWYWSDPAVACCAGHVASSFSLQWWKQFHLSSSAVYQNKTKGRTLSASALSGTRLTMFLHIVSKSLLDTRFYFLKTSRGTLWRQVNNINGPSWTRAPMMQITADMMVWSWIFKIDVHLLQYGHLCVLLLRTFNIPQNTLW